MLKSVQLVKEELDTWGHFIVLLFHGKDRDETLRAARHGIATFAIKMVLSRKYS